MVSIKRNNQKETAFLGTGSFANIYNGPCSRYAGRRESGVLVVLSTVVRLGFHLFSYGVTTPTYA